MSEQYLPKEQLEAAQKLVSSEMFRAIERVLTARKPDHPNPVDPMSKQTADAFLRAGFEKALDDLRSIPHELEEKPTNPDIPALDTRD